ncbi:unnamed protein product [Malus baccata var. baccata]
MTAHEASSSSSSKSKHWSYDVFLSFSGEDTRNGFTSHLHEALKNRGYHVFIDEDGLKRGEEIKEKLFRAIKESRISIIVFSRMYADSSWCLDELVKIMECRDKLGRHVLPIFYHIDPSDVRKQDGDLAEAFQKHEKDIHEEKDDKEREAKQERVKQWREALTKAANLSGHHLQIAINRKRRREGHTEDTNLSDHQTTGNGREAEFIKKIVDESIWEWLPRTNELHVTKHLVGIKSRIQGIISDLSSGGSNDVLMVGIWGMGGLGKTTAAKRIYNQIHREFEFKSFLADVSDNTSKHGLVYLQETLISDIHILEEKSRIRSVDKGISMIQEVVKHKRVLVVMDNIDEEVQLHAIAGSCDWFGPGSRIIITTRDERLLLNVDKVYPLQVMNEDEALELFSWHAFGNRWPDEVYLEVSKKVVSYCGGLPLALEILGSFLFKRPIAEWKSQFEKLKITPDGKIIKPLRISFEGLDDTQKAIFLDISCFFIGKDKDYVAKILDECKFFATIGISVLRERCLVTVEDNKLNMHDLLREMARVVISEKFPGRPGKWCRLWDDREVMDVLINKSGTRNVEGLALDLQSSNEASFSTKAFAKMKKLRLLDLSGIELKGQYKHLPKELIWLRWKCPLKSIPDDFFNQPRLVVLEMQESKLVQVWKGSKSLHNLKILHLSNSWYLQKSPDFSQVPNLEELILEKCDNLFEIHPSIGHLKRLSLVNLTWCRNLISLPRDFYKSKSVETLLLNWCLKFREVHEDIGEMISLRTLEANNTAIREVPPSIVGLKNLTRLSLSGVESNHLPHSLHDLNSLRELDLSCYGLNSLRELDLSCCGSAFEKYRITIELKGEYKYLCWVKCPLKSIPDDFFSQDKLVGLEMQCSKLVQVWEGSKSLHNLKTLDLSYSPSLQKSPDISQVPNLEELILEECESLSEIHPSIGHLKRLSLVNLQKCDKLISLPRDFYKSKSVETLLLNWCSKFREVHEDIGEMISLRTLEADDTAIREVPPSIVKLKNLTRLSLSGLESIHLPYSLHGLNSLRELDLSFCSLADDAIPKDLGSLISLQVLDLSWNDFHTLPSLSGLSKLETLRLDTRFNLRTIPDIPPNVKVQRGYPEVNESNALTLAEKIGWSYHMKTIFSSFLLWSLRFFGALEADSTAIRQVPPSIVGLKNLTFIS